MPVDAADSLAFTNVELMCYREFMILIKILVTLVQEDILLITQIVQFSSTLMQEHAQHNTFQCCYVCVYDNNFSDQNRNLSIVNQFY